jgi:hypothetical protein
MVRYSEGESFRININYGYFSLSSYTPLIIAIQQMLEYDNSVRLPNAKVSRSTSGTFLDAISLFFSTFSKKNVTESN